MSRPAPVKTKASRTLAERQIAEQVKQYLEKRGIYTERLNAGFAKFGQHWMRLGKKGAPDRIACYKGRFIAFEFKTLDGRVSEDQIRVHEEIRRSGGLVLVVTDYLEVIKFFNELDGKL